jgi:cephalosporin hydroxylase
MIHIRFIVQDSKLDRFNKRHSNGIHHFTDKFLKENDKFIMDRSKELRFFYTQHAKGYLKRIK